MTAIRYDDTYQTWDDLVRVWCELDVPEGYRPELTTEGIIMTPGPGGAHNLTADLIHRALVTCAPPGCGVFQTQSVGVREIGGIFIPDFSVMPRDALPDGSEPVLAEHVLLVAEITSRSNAAHDRKKKRWAYAHGGIPLYLLVDRFDPNGASVILLSQPSGGQYRHQHRVQFGEPITLPEPFTYALDTSDF